MPRENKNQYPILGFLSKQDRSGYDLVNYSKKIGKHYWTECTSQVYGILKKLENNGLVVSTLDETSGGRNRRVYSITPKGTEHLIAWLESPLERPLYRDELLLRLSNAQHLSSSVLLKHFQAEAHRLEAHLLELKITEKHIIDDHDKKLDQPNLLDLYDYKKRLTDMRLAWVRKMISKIQKKKK